MRQDVGNISRNIESGGERVLFVAVATHSHFPACDVERKVPLAAVNSQKQEAYQDQETYDTQM